MNQSRPNVRELLEEKLGSFQERFAEELGGLPDTGAKNFTIDNVLANVIAARPLWSLLDKEDFNTLLMMADVTAEAQPFTDMYRSLDEERKALLHRYVIFFYRSARQLIE